MSIDLINACMGANITDAAQMAGAKACMPTNLNPANQAVSSNGSMTNVYGSATKASAPDGVRSGARVGDAISKDFQSFAARVSSLQNGQIVAGPARDKGLSAAGPGRSRASTARTGQAEDIMNQIHEITAKNIQQRSDITEYSIYLSALFAVSKNATESLKRLQQG